MNIVIYTLLILAFLYFGLFDNEITLFIEFIEEIFPNIFQLAMKYILFVIKNNLIYMF